MKRIHDPIAATAAEVVVEDVIAGVAAVAEAVNAGDRAISRRPISAFVACR